MNILLLGSGGREHALAWKLSQSNLCTKLLVAPGNAGTATIAINMPFDITDFQSIENSIRSEKISLVIVGPEEPLVKGIVDHLNTAHQQNSFSDQWVGSIGPSQQAAHLEGSKAFAKQFMMRHGIPTARYREFTAENFEEGLTYLKDHALPVVLKADGLAAGKGVLICQNQLEALSEFELMIQRSKFGEAGKKVVVEEFLSGIELSVFVLTDGKDYLLLPSAKDYKRIGEGDKGLNTGGMGAVSPVPFADAAFMKKVEDLIIRPTISGLKKENWLYKGFIFFGLMNVNNEPYLIEYNCRMGDPETEVVIPRIKNDLLELLIATANGKLHEKNIEIDERFATTIVAVSGGYPNEYEKGFEIINIPDNKEDVLIFHMGTKNQDGKIVTGGGRVICATALADTLDEAINKSRDAVEEIKFEEKYFRRDIGFEFLDTNYDRHE